MRHLWMMTVSRNVHMFLYSKIKILEKSETKEVRRFITQT
jgi:predicted ATPase